MISKTTTPELRLGEIKAILFDFGGTLVSLTPSRETIFTQAASTVGLELELETVKRAYQIVDFHNKYSSVIITKAKDRDDFYRNYNQQLCEALGISSYFAKLHPSLVYHFKKRKLWELFEDTQPVLNRLQKWGIPLALVANWDENLAALTKHLEIQGFFSCIVSSQEAGVEKPNPAIFKQAIETLSLSVDSDGLLYVGNEYRADVLGARAADLVPVLIDRDEDYPHADCIRFHSLANWLASME